MSSKKPRVSYDLSTTRGARQPTSPPVNTMMELDNDDHGTKRKVDKISRPNSIMAKANRKAGAGKRDSTEGTMTAYKAMRTLQLHTATYVSSVNEKNMELMELIRNGGIELQKALAKFKGELFADYTAENMERSIALGEFMDTLAVKKETMSKLRMTDRNVTKEIVILNENITPVAASTVSDAQADHQALQRMSPSSSLNSSPGSILSVSMEETPDGLDKIVHKTELLSLDVVDREIEARAIMDLNLRNRCYPATKDKPKETVSPHIEKIIQVSERLSVLYKGCSDRNIKLWIKEVKKYGKVITGDQRGAPPAISKKNLAVVYDSGKRGRIARELCCLLLLFVIVVTSVIVTVKFPFVQPI